MSQAKGDLSKSLKLEDDFFCFVCGKDNNSGLKLKFDLEADTMKTEFTPAKIHQGFANIVHGGIISTVLDEVMLNLLFKKDIYAVTAELKVRFRKPTKIGEKLLFKSWITDTNSRLIETAAEAKNEKGDLIADAKAKCFIVEVKKQIKRGQ